MQRFINRNTFFIIGIIFMSACNVSKDLSLPKSQLPTSFRNASVTQDTSSIATIQWKVFFTDAVLQRLIDTALTKNYDMQIALKNMEAANVLFKQVNWNYVPALALNVTANTNRPSDNSLNGLSTSQFLGTKHVEDYNANLSLTWEADIWGKIRNQHRSALASYLQTSEAKKAIQTNIVATVSQGYYNLLMLDGQLAIAQKNIKLNDSTLRIIHLQYDAGQATLLAVRQAEAQKLAAAQLVPEFEQNIVIQENALRQLAGELPASIEHRSLLSEVVIHDKLSAGVPSALVRHRPDVKSAELALTIANANVGIAQANMYPSLTISASTGLNAFKASKWFKVPASLFGNAAASLAQPLLQHRLLNTQYKVALLDREKAVLQFRQSVLKAVGEVSDALVKIEKLKTQQEIISNRVHTLQKATADANLLFRSGQANYLEIITAQGNILQSELDLATVMNARLNSFSELYRSLGGGWSEK